MKKYKTIVRSITRIVISVLLGSCILGYSFSRRFIYYPKKISIENAEYYSKAYKNIENVKITTNDKLTLAGWFINNADKNKLPTIIYFGGNAEEVSWLIESFEQFQGFNVCLINYRGYGLSTGRPTEDRLFSDGLKIYDYLANRKDVDSDKIYVIGKSLGSGVAVYLASKRKVKKLVLSTPYDSMVNVAKDHVGIFSVLLADRFDSLKYLKSVTSPVLVIAAEKDTVIPEFHARCLYSAIKGEKEFKLVKNTDHNEIVEHRVYWEWIYNFLRGQ